MPRSARFALALVATLVPLMSDTLASRADAAPGTAGRGQASRSRSRPDSRC